MNYIFDEIIETEIIFKVIDEKCPDKKEKEYLVALVKDTIHHKVVDFVLDELDEEKQIIFLSKLDDEESHKGTIEKLKEWIEDFEVKVGTKVKEAEAELISLISNV